MNEKFDFPKEELFEVGFLYHEPYEIHDWFKRCIEDFPFKEEMKTLSNPQYKMYPLPSGRSPIYIDEWHILIEWAKWFDRWFSPFKEIKND